MSTTVNPAAVDNHPYDAKPSGTAHSAHDAPELSVIKVLILLAKHKKKLLGVPLACALIAVAASFGMPNVYQSSTKLLPPQQQQSGAAALLSQLGGMAGAVAGGAGLKNPNDLYIGMLRSRTIADAVIAKHQLDKVYGFQSPARVRQELEKNTEVVTGKDGLITISVSSENKALVARLANTYVDELIRLTGTLAVTEASQRRVFYERQLERAKNNLADAELSLKSALETRGVVSVDAESRAIVETVGRVRAQISAKQIEISSMSAFLTPSNPEYRRAQEQLASLRAELSKLENGRPQVSDTSSGTKSVGLENIKILRDVKYYQMLYEMLAKQYEVARLDEARDSAIIQVLDRAIEPEKKSSPKRLLIGVVAAMVGLFLTLVGVFAIEAKRGLVNLPGGAARWDELKSTLRK